uniref:Bleomycin hydrolase n=1 Tax=Iconisemion striatum TaxID=60296 RepID=A0A1A7XEQ4_9TELE
MEAGLSQEKVTTFVKRLRTEPRYLLAQNVSTCTDPLEVCLHRQTVQDTVHIFQHSIPTEGKPITNQKNSGSPPDTICWEFRDKEKNFHRMGPLTPQQFYREHVKPLYNMQDKVCLVNDPRPQNPYGKLYSVEFLGNMVDGHNTLYNNQPIQLLKKAAADSIKDGEAVWFGCDVGKHFHSKLGINDMNVFNHDLVFGVSVKNLSKAERLIYGDSLMTHAMILTAVTDKDGKEGYEKWRVENSWGDDRGNKGYLIMTDDWFSEYVYEVVVDKKFLPSEVLDVMQQEPIVLPAWDPMGALA